MSDPTNTIDKLTREQIDAISECIWDWAKHSDMAWRHQPAASSPFYGHDTLLRQIEAIVTNTPNENIQIPYIFPAKLTGGTE